MMTDNQVQTKSHGRLWTVVRIMNVRLRFIFLMVLVGVVAGNWDRITNYYDRWTRPTHASSAPAGKDIEYYCPMHPNIVRDEQGKCPICGMPLSERAKTGKKQLPEGVLAQVELSPQKVQMGRIATWPVEYRMLSREIRTVGTVEYDETRRAFIAARMKGRIDKLFVNYTGQHVQKGEPLVWLYSPDLLVAQEELLTAVRTREQQTNAGEMAVATAQTLVDAGRRKLTLWGITDQQIDEIIKRGSPETHLTIHSPISGIVSEKRVLEGHYVTEGEDLYTIADLSRVWMQAKVFENDITGIEVGTAVEVTSVASPNEIFAGRITFVAYAVDPATRTIAARVEVDNPDLKLRPGMYVNAAIRLPVGTVTPLASTAPASASAPAGPDTGALAAAYMKMTGTFAADKTDPAEIKELERQARALAAGENKSIASQAAAIADAAAGLQGKDLKEQRRLLKNLSAKVIELVKAAPPRDRTLFIAHCPMVKADWLSPNEKIANPYYGSEMLDCGEITGKIAPSAAASSDERFATGYYCPVRPDRLFDKPEHCPVDKFGTRLVRIEKTLAVPESAVIDTGTRKIAYRESAPGTFEMVEVQLGPRAGEFYPVVGGLKPGERVATAGAFVVDAENRLNPGTAAQYFGASGGPSTGGHQH